MRGISTDKFSVNQIKFQPEAVKPAPENPVGGLRLLICVWPGVHESTNGLEACRVTDRNFEELSRRTSFNTKHAHSIRSFIFQLDRSEIRDAIGRDVFVRIAH